MKRLLSLTLSLHLLLCGCTPVATAEAANNGPTQNATLETHTNTMQTFSDVSEGAYYAEAVQWAVASGITVGTSSNTFSPDAVCTRAQIATFLWRAAGSPAVGDGVLDIPFSDVPTDTYYTDAVLWATDTGVTVGTGNTSFSPNADCTRGQIVTFLYRAANSPPVGDGTLDIPFSDVPADAYYASAVQWAVAQGITKGTGTNAFSPNKTCTRAEAVTFLYRSTIPTNTEPENTDPIQTEPEEQPTLILKINDTPVAVQWEENESVAALMELVREAPLVISMSMYGGFEQVGSIGQNLPRNDVQTVTEAGDIVLYSGSQIVVFYGSNSWAYTKLGRITDKSASEMTDLLGNEDVTITITIE